MGFGSFGIRWESKEMKKGVSGHFSAGGSAIAPTLGRYNATQEAVGHVGGSEYSVGALGVERCSATLFLQSSILSVFKGF